MTTVIEPRDYPTLFRTADATHLGITDRELRVDSDYRALYRGVHMNARRTVQYGTPGWADQQWMDLNLRLRAVLLLDPHAVGATFTAAQLYGLPIPLRFRDRHLHVTGDDRQITRKGITRHRQRDVRMRRHLGLPLQCPEDLFLDLAPHLDLDELVAVGDAIVGRWHGDPLCTLVDLKEHAAGRKYLRARQKLQRALDLIREDVDSPKETSTRLWFLDRGLPEPEVHPPVFCPTLGRTVRPDLGFPEARLAIEYEGDQHRSSRQQWNRDIERYEALQAAGWTVLRITADTSMRVLERRIRAHLGLD